MPRINFCSGCGARLLAHRDHCPACGRRARIPDGWWYGLAGLLGLAAGLWRAAGGVEPAWVLVITVGTGVACALAVTTLLHGSPPPMTPHQGRRTWWRDGLTAMLLTQALGFGVVFRPGSGETEVSAATELVIATVVLPLIVALPIAGLRRLGWLNRPFGILLATTTPCPGCHRLVSARAPYCWSCGHAVTAPPADPTSGQLPGDPTSGHLPGEATSGRDDPAGAQHGPATRRTLGRLLAGLLLPGLLLGGWLAGWLDPVAALRGPGGQISACDDLEGLTTDYARQPTSPGGEHDLHPLATTAVVQPFDDQLRHLLLRDVEVGALAHRGDQHGGLDTHARAQSNPAARELAVEHGFVREVSRDWADRDRNALTHTVTQLASPRDAEAFLVAVGRYSCRFADRARAVELPASAEPAVGLRLHHGDGVVAEQVVWVRDGRRHSVTLFDVEGKGDAELVDELAGRAARGDDGTLAVPPP